MNKFISKKAALAKLSGFAGEHDQILLFIPDWQYFLSVSFGDGSNSDTLSDDCDSYLYLNAFEYDGYEFIDKDGGIMAYSEARKHYDAEIANAVFDAIGYMSGNGTQDTIPDFVPITIL